MRDTRKSGLGARGGAIRVPVGGVDVRLFGGRGGGGRESHGGEKKKGIGPFSIALLHNLIFIDTGD